MRFSSAANRPNDGGPWPDRRHRRSRTLPRLRDACVVAGCFGLMSVQLFSSVTLMGLKQVVEEAARPGVSRRSSSSAKSIVGGATSRQMSAELDGPTAPQGGALPRHKKPSFRGQLDAKARQDEAGDREAPQEGAKPTAAAAEQEDDEVASSPTSMITSIQWPEMQHLERPKEQFKRYDNVVVATKVFGPEKVEEMKQMFCLFMAAYNRHVNYDIVMFTTLPWEDEQVQELRKVVGPSVNLTVVLEAKPLLEQVAEMSPEDRDYLYRRCRVPWDGQISYYHWCLEEPNTTDKPFFDVRLSYAWQAEFRARHVWHMPVLEKYKYMLWIDSDAFCTKPWDVDPVQVAVENDLVILFDNFPGDTADNPVLKDKMVRAYNRSLCELYLEDGHFKGRDCDEEELSKPGYWLKIVHGFFHVTNLDFYRSPSVTKFLDVMMDGKRFSREWDDQIAVTVPAAIEAPERSWDMRAHGLHLEVWHNGNIDGKIKERPMPPDDNFIPYWNETGRGRWSFGSGVCESYVVSNG